jgi:hypothetical protein
MPNQIDLTSQVTGILPLAKGGTGSSSTTQSANFVWCGPTTGAAAAPTFRALVAADIPLATSSAFGAVKPDNSTITIAAGVISAVGGGTVTSVDMSVPTGFTISGNPVTGAGTLALGLSNETANFVWAGPTSGGAAPPTFRALVSGDIPSLAYVPTARTITTTSPLTIDGGASADLSANRTLAVGTATSSVLGVVKPDNSSITISAGVISATATGTVTGSSLTANQPVFGNGLSAIIVGTKRGNTTVAQMADNTTAPTTGHLAVFDVNGNITDGGAPSGGGSVTSVAMTVPAELSVAGSPVTTSGTLAVTWATESANKVFAGPTTGAAATPTFRSLVAADVAAITGLTLLEQHTASSSATLNFTTCITAAYDEYEIHFVNIVPATNSVSWQMKVSTDGGSTYVGGTSYNYGMIYSGIGDNPTQSTGSGVAAIDLAHSVSTTANYSVNGTIVLFNPGGSTFKFINGKTQAMALGNLYQWGNSGVYLATTAVNAFQFLFSSGNIASGTIRVYGLGK